VGYQVVVNKLKTILVVRPAANMYSIAPCICCPAGPQPIVGYQVVVNYIAMNDKGREFENSLGKAPFDVRVGAGQVIPGLDEGMLSMKVGGVRRLYIPGELAFPKPLKAAAGR
jgi:peptidylprolyl isomerase